MFESKAMVLWVAGLAFFVIALVANLLVAAFTFKDLPERSTKELPNPNLMYEFEDLSKRFPESFAKHFGQPSKEKCAEALELVLGAVVLASAGQGAAAVVTDRGHQAPSLVSRLRGAV